MKLTMQDGEMHGKGHRQGDAPTIHGASQAAPYIVGVALAATLAPCGCPAGSLKPALLLPGAGANAFWQLRFRAATLCANGGSLGTAGGGSGCTANNADKSEEHGPVDNCRDDQKSQVYVWAVRDNTAHNQVDQAGDQDVAQCYRDEDQPGKLHQLVST